LAEVDGVLLGQESGQVARFVGDEVGGGEGLDGAGEIGLDAAGGGHRHVVEELLQRPVGRLPADPSLLTGHRLAVLLHLHVDVVVIAGVGGPLRIGGGVEGPEREVDALQRGHARARFEIAGAKP